ncbi:MAG: DNA mismatch repair protein MutL, partial [Bacteroidetes bacterium]
PGNLRQRIVKVFGEAANKKLVPVQEETDILKITGFVGKPDYFKKTRGEQIFFVNKRFIKSNYLHHAVVQAYEDMLPPDTYPLYVLFLDIDPGRIDINVHPTKQEIKFDDEKLVYNYLKVTVRHALGAHSITPTLDFEQEPAFQAQPARTPVLRPSGKSSESVRDYSTKKPDQLADKNLRNWQRLYEGLDMLDSGKGTGQEPLPSILPSDATPPPPDASAVQSGAGQLDDEGGSFSKGQKEPYQIHGLYIVSQIKSGFLLIDQQAASERILYERYLEALRQQPVTTQKALFPKNIELPPADANLLREILDEVNRLGFDISEFGGHAFIIHGAPSDMGPGLTEELLLERLLTQYKNNLELELGVQENLARSMARSAALKRGQTLSVVEMQDLIDHLFACASPYRSPSGRTCFITYELDELQKRFES